MKDGEKAVAFAAIYSQIVRSTSYGQYSMERCIEPTADNYSIDWIAKAFNNDRRHPCWLCALGTVPFGIVVPFIYDLGEEFGDGVSFQIGENLIVKKDGARLLSIEGIALYCNSGDSHNVRARLQLVMYTGEGATTEHKWDDQLPRTSFFEKRKAMPVLNTEVSRLLSNDIYSESARRALRILMDKLCVGFRKIRKTSFETGALLEQGNKLLLEISLSRLEHRPTE